MTWNVNIYGVTPEEKRGQDISDALRALDWDSIPGAVSATLTGTDSQGSYSQSFQVVSDAQGIAEDAGETEGEYVEVPATDPRPWDHGTDADVMPKPLVPQEADDAPQAPVAAPVTFHADAGPGSIASIEERSAVESADAAQIAPAADVTTPAGETPPEPGEPPYVPDTEPHDAHPDEQVTADGQEPDNAHELDEQPEPSPDEAAGA